MQDQPANRIEELLPSHVAGEQRAQQRVRRTGAALPGEPI
jgi:hypothetical protein